MPRSTLVALGVVAVLATTGCTTIEPEFAANDQVPAEQRTTEAPVGDGDDQPPGGGGEPAGVFVVEGNDLAFDQVPQTLPAGEVTITLENMGGLEHNVVFEGIEGDDPIVTAAANASDTGTVELSPSQYTFYCSIAGHREAGMEGTVTVQ